jgi:hypothetical protein
MILVLIAEEDILVQRRGKRDNWTANNKITEVDNNLDSAISVALAIQKCSGLITVNNWIDELARFSPAILRDSRAYLSVDSSYS